MRFFFLAFPLFFISLTYGQTVRIRANIAADKDALSLGQITIFSLPDSTLRKGSYLDSTDLNLALDTKGNADFYAKIAVPNYKDSIISFSVVPGDTLVDFGILAMQKDQSLEEVEILYRKEMFVRTMDGISVNVEGTNLQSLTNLFEVLKASPKLTSPDDERIEIIGRGSPLILVDRQAIISNDELKAIPANQIERIEIITNPSAKYKAQGSGNGVIEVYTKNFHLEGYNMTIRADGGLSTQSRPQGGLSAGLSLKRKKFSLNGYLGANYNAQNGFGNSSGFTTDDSFRSLTSNYDFNSINLWQYYNVKAAYNVSDKQRITIGVNGHGSGGSSDNVSSSVYANSGIDQTRSESTNESTYTWLNNSAFINYTVETDTNKSNFEINLNYVNKVSSSDATSMSRFEFIPDASISNFGIRNDSRDIPNIGEFRTNYEHVFDTAGWKLNIGMSYSALFNGKRFDQFNDVDGTWIIDTTASNSYDYQEHIGAAFFDVAKKWKKVGFRVGLRAEYTKLDGYSNSLNQQFMDSSYILPFPNASILLEPSDKVAITVFYNSGIDRPQFSNYDPFVRQSDSLEINYGNPFLRPSVEQTVGFEVDLFYAYNFSMSYSHIKDPISSISFIRPDSYLTENTPMNALAEDRLSASFSIPFQTKWLQGWNSVWVDYSKYSFTPIFGRDPFFNLTYGVYSYLTFSLPKDFSLMNRFHLNKWGGAESRNSVVANWGLRLTKKYNGNNLQFFADVSNIIPPKYKSTQFSGNYEYQSVSQNQFTTFKLGIFVKFGRLKAAAQIQESSSGQSDRL
jgi:iron complex outermembrane recepter protein